MKDRTIFTNGISFFTLENYSPSAGVCHANGITIHKKVSPLRAKALHSNGTLHYVTGIGDTKHIKDLKMRRGLKIGSFEIH